MNSKGIPQSDSIQELANFWDSHDLTDFESELSEVTETVFQRDDLVQLHLPKQDLEII